MGRNIDLDKPLSEEDEKWLRDRSRGWQVDENKRRLHDIAKAKGKTVEVKEPYVHPYTVGAEPYGPGGDDPRRVPSPLVDAPVAVPYDPDVPDEDQEVVRQYDPDNPTGEETFDIDDLNVEDLKDELRARGEPTSGNKDELRERLREAVAKDE